MTEDVHHIWKYMLPSFRNFKGDFSSFLRHPTCKWAFVRTGWGDCQEYELNYLKKSTFGNSLLNTVSDPEVGKPEISLGGRISTNMLGMMYYLARVKEAYSGDLPDRVIEVGGGYGAFSYLFCQQNPKATYVIVDLPEVMELQNYFLSQSMPERKISREIQEGQTALIPSSEEVDFKADLFFSTFAFTEMTRSAQLVHENKKYYGASHVFIAGESSEPGFVHSDEVIGGVKKHFSEVTVEKFHTGNNYLVQGRSE